MIRVFRSLLASLAGAAFLSGTITPLPAFAQDVAPAAVPPIDGRAAWDDRYIYFAFIIPDSDLLGTNSRPMSEPQNDDSIGVYFQLQGAPETPDTQTNAMIVSAANGFTFLSGDATAKAFKPRPLFIIKYAVGLLGTINRSDDRDRGWTVTMAVPLEALGLDPKTLKPGAEISFAAVARRRGAGEDKGGLTSTAPAVKTEADVPSPAKWGKLVFAAPADPTKPVEPGPPAPGVVTAYRIPPREQPPLIEGAFRPAAWPAASQFIFASPDLPRTEIVIAPAPLPGASGDSSAPPLQLPETLATIEPRLFARYLIHYQADPRKVASPVRGLFLADATLAFADQPVTGIGPWFSNDRTSWHRGQLSDMRRAGVDVALVSYLGPEHPLGYLDEKALLVLVAAEREMLAERTPGPLLAPCLDTSAVVAADKPRPDLATSEGRETLYRALKTWFTVVPPELRARVTLPADSEGRVVMAYPVYLSSPAGLENLTNREWQDDLRKRFAADFGVASGGTTLLLCGGDGFGAEAGLAAVTPLTTGSQGMGPIPTAVVRPGIVGLEPPLSPRQNGETYKKSWEAVTRTPGWIILDSWNDWVRGTEIAPSRQYGDRYIDLTRLYSALRRSEVPKNVAWLSHDAPRRLRPGQLVTVTVGVKNTGVEALRGSDGVALTYRWRDSEGKVVAEAPVRLPLSEPLLPTRTHSLPLGIFAAQADAGGVLTPLPPGEYTLEIGLTSSPPLSQQTLFGEDGASGMNPPLRLRVSIQADWPELVEFGGTTTPPLMNGGASYPVQLRLRWLGKEPLTPEQAQLLYQVLTEDGKPTGVTATLPLSATLRPGVWQTVLAEVRAGDAGGPLPTAAPEGRPVAGEKPIAGGYKLRWLLSRRESTDAVPGEYLEQIAVYPPADEARLSITMPPAAFKAGVQTTVEVTLENRGATKWPKGEYGVGYHWYFPDGIEFQWQPQLVTQLTRDLEPGQSVKVPVLVRVPDRDGEYILAFDVARNPNIYLSTLPVTRTGELGLIPVRVTGGRLVFADLGKFFNVDAVATEASPADGDLDGQGNTLPAESFPPDAFGIAGYFHSDKEGKPAKETPVYPSGYFAEISPSARLVSFRYGPEAEGAKNAVACAGQVVPLPGGRYATLHLAAAATGGEERPLELVLNYKGGETKKVSVPLPDWNQAPGASDPVAVRALRKRGREADSAGFAGVRHRIIPLDIQKEIVSVTLPQDEKIKVFAITLER